MQRTGRRGITWRTPNITADALKIFAGVIMLLQNFSIIIVEKGMIHLDQYTQQELSQALADDSDLMFLAGVGSILQLIGGLAVPVFAFLLTEGFRYTSSYRNYLLSMVLFALLTEVPYDFAMSQKLVDWSRQNALAAMCVCLLMLYFLRMFAQKKGFIYIALRAGIILCALFWVTLLRAEYGLCLVLLTAIFYLLHDRNILKTILGGAVSLLYVTGPLAFYAIWFYDERRKDIVPKYVYYIFYPAHFLVLGLIRKYYC